ncbi:MAG: phosphatidate cytidylyltransferase [Planctomycetota bacterium]
MRGLTDRLRWGVPILLISIGLLVADLQQWTDGYGLMTLAFFFGIGACYEALTLRDDHKSRIWIGCLVFLWSGWTVMAISLDPLQLGVVLLGTTILLGSLLSEAMASNRRSLQFGLTTAVLTGSWLVLPTVAVWILAETDPLGVHMVLFALLTVKSADTGAYFTGRAMGRTSLHPVSPKKTVEGLLGGVLSAALVGFAYAQLLGDATMSPSQGVFLAVLVALVGQLSDLQESALKRAAGRKDSGNTIPGLGGLLDMLDSMLLAVPMLLLLRRVLAD